MAMTGDELRGAVLSIAQEVTKWDQDNSYPNSEGNYRDYDEARADMHTDAVDAITQLAKDIA